MNRCFVFIALLFFVGCGHSMGAHKEDSEAKLNGEIKIDLFSARGFLGGSEYERYFLNGNILWRECGSISPSAKSASGKSELEGDHVLSKDPQLSIQERRVEKLSSDEADAIRSRAEQVLKTAQSKSGAGQPPPGSVFSLGSPGVFEMLVEIGSNRERIISSVDAVADKKSATLEKAHELFAVLRGLGPEICGSKTFYGIERRSL